MYRNVVLVLALSATAAWTQPPTARTQVFFAGPSEMEVRWLHRGADGKEAYSKTPLVAPARFSFAQGGLYRLKLSRIRGYRGLDLYPTLEVPPATPATQEFLAHNAVRLELTDADLREVAEGKLLRKAIHLPDASGPPLLILRIGNADLEAGK